MNVKIKPSDSSLTFFGGIIAIFMFFVIPIIVLGIFIKVGFEIHSSSDGIVLYGLFPLFIVFSFFLIVGCILMFYLVKRPKKYKAKLKYKKEQMYKNEYIIYLGFEVYDQILKKYGASKEERKDIGKADFWCYTDKQNNLSEGKDYYVYIKEFNWSIKKIEELVGNIHNEYDNL